jgi:anthranilate synthase component I
MLLDLGRNDVGRVARYGTVRVPERMVIEKYSHVLHMVSTVEGELRDGLSAIDVFRATFPAGTVSGAPKVRAMEIIDELEPVRRGPTPAPSATSATAGSMDTAIAIRTVVARRARARAGRRRRRRGLGPGRGVRGDAEQGARAAPRGAAITQEDP